VRGVLGSAGLLGWLARDEPLLDDTLRSSTTIATWDSATAGASASRMAAVVESLSLSSELSLRWLCWLRGVSILPSATSPGPRARRRAQGPHRQQPRTRTMPTMSTIGHATWMAMVTVVEWVSGKEMGADGAARGEGVAGD